MDTADDTADKKASDTADDIKRKGDAGEDYDVLLERSALEALAEKLRVRYHMKWHASVEPSGYLISKCTTRLASRTIQLDNLWGIKTLVNQ